MTTVTFDTHEFIKDLQAKGFKPEQAEGISNALKNVMTIAEIATTRDLKELESAMTLKLAENKAEIIKWNIGAILASVGLAVTLIKVFS
jgi:capsular polysaccharide biosynthesis protein